MKCIQPYGQAQLLSLIARSLSRTAQRGLWFMNFMVYLLAIFTAHCPPMTYRFINYLTVVLTSSLSRRSTAVTPPHLMEPFLDPHLKVVQDTVCLSVPCEFMQWSR